MHPVVPAHPEIVGNRFRLAQDLFHDGLVSVFEANESEKPKIWLELFPAPPDNHNNYQPLLLQSLTETASILRSCSQRVAIIDDAGIDLPHNLLWTSQKPRRGLSLAELVHTIGPLHPTIAARIMTAVCECLVDAKLAGVLHGCLTPSQIFLEHSDRGEIAVRLFGFGRSPLALLVLQQEIPLRAPSLLAYAAPELLRPDQVVTQRSDIFSVSLILYFALSGVCPTISTTNSGSLKFPDLQDVAPWVEAGLAHIAQANLGVKPESRCASIDIVAESLRRYCAGVARLSAATLIAVPSELRETDAARVIAPASWSQVRSNLFPPAATDAPLVGEVLNSRYALVRLVGKGGMGAVYEARAPNGSRVAVKAILADSLSIGEEMLRRFLREARVLTSIKNPYVVKILNVGTDLDQNIPYIAMEYLDGQDLRKVIKAQGALDSYAAIRLFVQICGGVSTAHERGIVHRDIKPANIFLHELPSGEIVPKLCDFGIARLSTNTENEENTIELTRTGRVLGSPVYMSPEQARNARDTDARTDIWSLGISLWEVLSGCRPWHYCSTYTDLIVEVCTREVEPLQDVAPWLSPELCQVIHKALQPSPTERYASAQSFAKALEPFACQAKSVFRHQLVAVPARKLAAFPGKGLGRTAPTPSMPAARSISHSKPASAFWGAIALAIAGGGWVLAWKGKAVHTSGNIALAESSTLQNPTAPVAAPTRFNVQVGGIPKDATVFVNSLEKSVEDFTIVLTGEPGESFLVQVIDKNIKSETVITITKEGTARPARVQLAPERPESNKLKARTTVSNTQPTPPKSPSPNPSPPATPGNPFGGRGAFDAKTSQLV